MRRNCSIQLKSRTVIRSSLQLLLVNMVVLISIDYTKRQHTTQLENVRVKSVVQEALSTKIPSTFRTRGFLFVTGGNLMNEKIQKENHPQLYRKDYAYDPIRI